MFLMLQHFNPVPHVMVIPNNKISSWLLHIYFMATFMNCSINFLEMEVCHSSWDPQVENHCTTQVMMMMIKTTTRTSGLHLCWEQSLSSGSKPTQPAPQLKLYSPGVLNHRITGRTGSSQTGRPDNTRDGRGKHKNIRNRSQ